MTRVRTRLFVMMLLEYAAWGAWAAVAGKYMTDPPPQGLGFSGALGGLAFSFLPLGAIISPLLAGQLADRWMRAEHLQGILSLASAAVLVGLAFATEPGPFLALMLLYAFLFAPTVTLTNAIAFAHLRNPARDFGPVRTGGTLGWFLALGFLAGWRGWVDTPVPGDLFWLAAGFSAVLGIFSFFLPPTPPQRRGGPLALVEALRLLKNRNFAVFFVLSLILGAMMDFYYIFSSAYLGTPSALGGVGADLTQVPLLLMIPPGSELLVMATLGTTLPRLGVKRALAIGFGAWVLRFALFAASPSMVTVLPALLLHGISISFVLAVGSLYVNQIAPSHIRASAQAIFTLATVGVGRFVGTHVAGWVATLQTHRLPEPFVVGDVVYREAIRWPWLFAVPFAVIALATVCLLLFFREPSPEESAAAC